MIVIGRNPEYRVKIHFLPRITAGARYGCEARYGCTVDGQYMAGHESPFAAIAIIL